MAEIVAATSVTIEIYLAHVVGKNVIEECADALSVPAGLEDFSVRARVGRWGGTRRVRRPGMAVLCRTSDARVLRPLRSL